MEETTRDIPRKYADDNRRKMNDIRILFKDTLAIVVTTRNCSMVITPVDMITLKLNPYTYELLLIGKRKLVFVVPIIISDSIFLPLCQQKIPIENTAYPINTYKLPEAEPPVVSRNLSNPITFIISAPIREYITGVTTSQMILIL